MKNPLDLLRSIDSTQIFRLLALILILVMVAVFGFYGWVSVQGGTLAFDFPTVSVTEPQRGTATPSATSSPTQPQNPPGPDLSAAGNPGEPVYFAPLNQGSIILSISEQGYAHLFAYQEGSALIRLTNGPWHDIQPNLSHDGSRVAFTSNRDGQWDLYLLDLRNGAVSRLTETRTYDGSPSLSPDGLWMAYESYVGGYGGAEANLEIYVRPVDGSERPIRLTKDAGADHQPQWSPQGRLIAFISTRSGDSDVWIADLDKAEERLENISHNASSKEAHPAWSPDGNQLSWSSSSIYGIQTINTFDLSHPLDRPREVNSGDWSAWSPTGDALLVSLQTPNKTYLSSYSLTDNTLSLPALALGGPVSGMTWSGAVLPQPLPETILAAARLTPTPNWAPTQTPGADIPGSRQRLVALPDSGAEPMMLQDRVDDSFVALRERVARETGWDFLSNLEAAFVPLTSPLSPGKFEDWLYTGRAFSFNSSPYSAGWVTIVREDYGPKTYWRVFLRTRFQDGTQGQPLRSFPWDFSARLSGDPTAYENGGAPAVEIPAGYWVDFTDLAATYGWERQPAMSSWKQAFSSTEFNKYVLSEGQDWMSAMLEIYPRTALDTYTPVPSPTHTPTITLTPTKTLTPTRTPWLSRTPTLTKTPWPTRTPVPTKTPWPSRTPKISPTPTNTVRPSRTPTPTPVPSYTPRPN